MTRPLCILVLFALNFFAAETQNYSVETQNDSIASGVDSKYVNPGLNSSDLSANVSVAPARLSRILDFYNTESLAANWKLARENVSFNCKGDVEKYISGLSTAEAWALKMDDASARYTTGWFWGNYYWTGSQTLCENIAPKEHNILQSGVKIEKIRNQRDAAVEKSKEETIGSSPGFKSGTFMYGSMPPFSLRFYMLKINLNTTFSEEERILHIGLCLPATCSEEDVQNIVEETSITSSHITIDVTEVRSIKSSYQFWKDNTFLVLCLVTLGAISFLLAGTFYDLHLRKIEAQKKSNTYGTTDIKLEVGNAEKSLKNGKSGVYMVNNNITQPIEDNTGNRPPTLTCGVVTKDLLLSFSLRTNIKNICDRSVGSDTIPVIHGLKSISMLWVILGHTCIVAFKYSDNMEYRRIVQKEFFFQTVTNGAFSVDTFFFTSGLLVSFLYFRTNEKGKLERLTKGFKGCTSGILHFLGLLAYRFARLTAPYLYVLGIVEVSMKWFKYNSIFEPPTNDHINCPNYWWRNILYINTLFPVDEMCMLWSWYLSDDTQFYVIGAIMLILATRHLKSAGAMLLVFLLSSWMTTAYIAYSNSHLPNSDDPLALFDKIYDKPWTRMGPYLIGMCVGWILFKTNCNIKMSKLCVTVGWLASIACLLSLVYGLYEVDLSPYAGAAYSSLSHSVWALGLAWIVIACSTGHGGYANSVLSASVLYPFSRITYCAYLIHPVVIRVMAMSLDSPIHLAKEIVFIIFLGQAVASYILGFMISVAFEAPVVSMLRILTKLIPNGNSNGQQR